MKRNRTASVAAIMLSVFGLFVAAGTVFAADLAELIALADKIKNENPGINLALATDKQEYQTGENVDFTFQADKDCYLVLIDIGTSGRTIFLFPNKWHTDNKIEKGKMYKVPAEGAYFSYRVEGPVGTERIKAIATVNPLLQDIQSLQQEIRVPLAQSPEHGGAFLRMKNPAMVLKDIGIMVAAIDPREWATHELQFKVAGVAIPSPPVLFQPPALVPQEKPPAPAEQPATPPDNQ